MEKTKVLCLVLAIVLASAGTAGVVMGFGGNEAQPIIPDNAVNTIMDKPSEGTPLDRTAVENLYIAQGELQRKGSFTGTTRGTTTSAGIKQEVINNRVVVNGNVFKEMITVGVVKNAYQLFIYDGNYLYRKYDSIKSASNINWANTASKFNENDFLMKFGHRSNSLTGYILNDSTILDGKLEKEENGLFQYRYVLDINTAPARMLYEMKTNSNMNGYSTFIKAEIIVVMDSNWQVKTVSTDCKYKVPMFGGLDCVEDLTETFGDYEGNDLPETEFFKDYFNAEVETPVEKDPDALNVLMDMFAPYIGADKRLNASIIATDDGQPVLNGLVSAKIDIENIENIEVNAKIGDGLFVEYTKGSVYVTYQDFKASTTVDGIMGVVNAFMPKSGASAQSDGATDEKDDDILSKFTYSIENGVCTVSLPLDLGEERLELNIYANVTDDGYQFTNANVTFGSLELNVELASDFDMPERSGDYPEILGLLDIVKNGVIYGNVNAFGTDLDVTFNLNTMSLYAVGDGLSVSYKDNVVYAEFGAIKAKLAVSDFDRIMTLLRLAGVMDGNASLELPQISVEQILSLLGNITAVNTENGVKFSLDTDGLSVALYLVSGENGWNIDKVTVLFGDNVLTLALNVPEIPETPEVNAGEYADVMELVNTFLNPIASLISAASYGAEFDFDVTAGGNTYNVAGNFAYDINKNIRVNAVVSNGSVKLIKANVAVVDKTVYLDVNGIKTAFATGEKLSNVDFSQIANGIYGANDKVDGIIEAIYGIVDTAKNLDLSKINFANLIKSFAFKNGELAMTVNADFIGLGEIGIKLSADKYNNLVAGVSGLNLDGLGLNAEVKVIANVAKVKAPNASDYLINLKGSVQDVEFALTADLLNMDIFANVDILGNTVLIRYVGGKVYVTIGEIAVVGTVNELGALIDYVMSALDVDSSAIDLGNLANVDLSLETLLNSLVVNVDNALQVNLNLDGLANISVNFDSEANFVGITADVENYQVTIEANDKQAVKLDTNNTFISVESLAKQFVEIYSNFKNILTTGIAADLTAAINVNGNYYNLTATVNYNNGLYVNANIVNNANALIALDMYLVNNVLYLDVNGVRIAYELPENGMTNNANVDFATVLGMLSKAKGYNDVLDSIIAVAEQLPEKLNGLDYVALVTKLTYGGDVLTADINGALLGLSEFVLTLSGTDNLMATVNGLAIGDVTVSSLEVNATPACGEVTAPTSKYITELQLEVMGYVVTAKLDLLRKEVTAITNVYGHDLAVYYVNGTAYVKFGAVSAKLDVADVNEIIGVISSFVDGGISMPAMPEINVKDVLDGISLTYGENGYALEANIAGASVTLSFDVDAKLTDACVNVNGIDIKASVLYDSSVIYPTFSVADAYVDLADLLDQAVAIYNDYKDVLSSGISANVNANVVINGSEYVLNVKFNYNNGLYVSVNIADNANALIALDMYLVNNVLYLDVNGVRVAYELPENGMTNNANVDFATVLGMLSKAKGYNDVLDSVIAVIEQLPANLDGINYLDLLSALTYGDGVLTLDVNGERLGLSDFGLTLFGTRELNATLSNLAIGNVTIANLAVNALPECGQVTAPSSEYVTEFEINVADYTVTAKLDLLNKTAVAKTALLGHELGVYYANNVIYLNYGEVKAMLNVNDIDKLLAVISSFVDGGISMPAMPEINVKDVLDGISLVNGENGYSLKVAIAGISVTLSFDVNAKLVDACVNLNDLDVAAKLINGATYPSFNPTSDYVDLIALVETFAGGVQNIINAQGYDVELNGSFAFDNNVYNVQANVTYNGGLYVNANVSYNAANMANVELWLVDNVLYASMGDLKFAIAVPQAAAQKSGSGKIDLTAYMGYNPYVDGVLTVVQGAIDKFVAGNVDYVSLISGLTFANGELTLNINGEQLGVALQSVKLAANNGLTANVNGLAVDKMSATFTATVKASDTAVVAPEGDFTTNLRIKINDANVLYANLDLINNVFNFRLDDMYIMYADNTVYVNKGDIYVKGSIDKIMEYVKKIDDLVNEFSGAQSSTLKGFNFDMFKNIDVKAIVSSLKLSSKDAVATLSVSAFGFDLTAKFSDGKIRVVTVPVSLIDETVEIEPSKLQTYDKFGDNIEYIAIEQILNEYYPVIEKLVHTNSWRFNFDGDIVLTMYGKDNQNNVTVASKYKVAAGSYIEFYYKNTEGMNTFKLRAKLDVRKFKGLVNGEEQWQEFMLLDIVYKDGNIYVSDTGRKVGNKNRNTIKLTVSVDTLVKCYGLYDEIVAVVPQIGELVDNMSAAMREAESNAEKISYSTILNNVSYVNGLFGMNLHGQSLLSKLGDIILSAQTYGSGLSLNELLVDYDNISVNVSNMRVYASELDGGYSDENKTDAKWDGGKQYLAVQDILAYDTNGHMDFNSLYELLNSFVVTATPTENSNGTRSFFIDGEATVKLKIIGLNLADIKIGLSVKVDITEDNKVYVAVKINRTKPSGLGTAFVDVYNDKGGDSYLYYDGVNEMFTVIRNSVIDWKHTIQEEQEKWVCTKCGKITVTNWCTEGGLFTPHGASCEKKKVLVDKEVTEKNYYYTRHYAAENLTTEQFTAGIMDYIMEMLNFGSIIKDPIMDAINKPSDADFGIEDILKNYAHEANAEDSGGKYALQADLTAIDSNLGAMNVDILYVKNHKPTSEQEQPLSDYSLTNLNVDVGLLNGMCQANVPFTLKPSVYGEATEIVNQVIFW